MMKWVTVEESVGSEQEFYWLWIFATSTYGVGDVVTTVALVFFAPGVQEGNPLVKVAIDSLGITGLVMVKLGVFFGLLALSVIAMHRWNDRLLYLSLPLGLGIFGFVLTVLNVWLMASSA